MEEMIKQWTTVAETDVDGYGYGYDVDGDGDGSGYNSSNGFSDGSGYGCGYGVSDCASGWGYGCGTGCGDGDYGYGYGCGTGCGDGGYGYGCGTGCGDGGSGVGSGYGIKSFCGETVYIIDGIQSIVKRIKGNLAKGYILNSDFTKTTCYVVKSDGCFAHGETLKKAREALQSKIFERMDIDETISEFRKKFKPGVKYPGEDYFVWHHYLTGSCEMGRRSFVNDRGIDLADTFTPEEFIEICKDAYGGEIIRQLKERYK